jgi:hypothetical protein
LLSRAVRDALGGAQPAGVSFKPLGFHQFHGLPQPLEIFQVVAADLPASFPPPRTLAASVGRRRVRS